MARFESMTLSELPSGIWRTRLRVRFGSFDPAGMVYTPEYLNLFNGVIEDWYGDALGLPYHELVGTRRPASATRTSRRISPSPAAWATCSTSSSSCAISDAPR